MFAAVLQSTKAALVAPAKLAFWEADFGVAMRANQFLCDG
jgi:hypothetical protein